MLDYDPPGVVDADMTPTGRLQHLKVGGCLGKESGGLPKFGIGLLHIGLRWRSAAVGIPTPISPACSADRLLSETLC